MTFNKSIAVWCEKAADVDDASVELHFNLWHFSQRKCSDFFEIGIMSEDPAKLEAIKIFLPFNVERKDVTDCGPTFRKPEIAQGIFNETLSCTSLPNGKCVELRDGGTIFCQVYQFTLEQDVIDSSELDISSKGGGTILTIGRQSLASLSAVTVSSERGYYRLRFCLGTLSKLPFLSVIKPADKFWTSGIDQIAYIDFRLNEARTLPRLIENDVRQAPNGLAKIDLIAFLTVVPVVSSIASSHQEWRKSRLLEHDIWREYVDTRLPSGMVVYHWKKELGDQSRDAGLASFSAFVKFHTRRSGGVILAMYILVAFIFGVVGNLTASIIEAWAFEVMEPAENSGQSDPLLHSPTHKGQVPH